MNDREYLELAAKACGMTVQEALQKLGKPISLYSEWNPLTDDGDALRLAVKLRLLESSWLGDMGEVDPYAATRRAIVRAAAEIGKAMT
jgi:hypothetical protein